MTQPEYKKTVTALWPKFYESVKEFIADGTEAQEAILTALMESFDSILGKQEIKQEIKQENDADTVIQGWVARDIDGGVYAYCYKPKRNLMKGVWEEEIINLPLTNNIFPDLTWSDDPEPVEIIIKRKNNGNIQ